MARRADLNHRPNTFAQTWLLAPQLFLAVVRQTIHSRYQSRPHSSKPVSGYLPFSRDPGVIESDLESKSLAGHCYAALRFIAPWTTFTKTIQKAGNLGPDLGPACPEGSSSHNP